MTLPVMDVCGLSDNERSERIQDELRNELEMPFDLTRPPLLRVRLLRLSEHEHVLLRTIHHILSDAWSEGIFNRELVALYEAYRAGRDNPLKSLSIQYDDYSERQRRRLENGALGAGLQYWEEQLAGMPEQLELYADQFCPASQSLSTTTCHVKMTAEDSAELKSRAQQNRSTLYVTLLAGLSVLLSRYAGQDDIVVGSPIANRPDSRFHELIGLFVNTLPMRVRVKRNAGFWDLVRDVKRTTLEAYEYQDVPFDRIVQKVAPKRTRARNPMFQVMFALQNAPWMPPSESESLRIEVVQADRYRARFDLEIHAWDRDGQINFLWLCREDGFDPKRIAQMSGHYLQLLKAVINDDVADVANMSILGEEERNQILEEWNDTHRDALPETVVELFEQQVEIAPDAVALVCEEHSVSYLNLNEWANRLSHYLINRGIGPEGVVGICMQHSPEMVVALLGILKSGAAFLPLDSRHPTERLAFQLKDASAACVVTAADTVGKIPGNIRTLVLDSLDVWSALRREPTANLGEGGRTEAFSRMSAAYVIYTSGSTGVPKGVLVEHGALTALFQGINEHVTFGAGRRNAALTTIAFDISILEPAPPFVPGF